ncbi:MAG: IS66 family insertion sequence element accessory protein TnpB [Polyangiales bacterium]
MIPLSVRIFVCQEPQDMRRSFDGLALAAQQHLGEDPRSGALFDPDVPIDNSPTEREFQNVAKLRLNMLFAGSSEGAHRACVLLGIVATCRAIGVPVQPYLAWAFERLGTHRDVFGLEVADMTPAAFKRSML